MTSKIPEDKKYKVLNSYGIVGTKKELTGGTSYLILQKLSWYGKKEVIDLRWWTQWEAPMKGVTMNKEELRKLKEILNELSEEQLSGYLD